MKKVFLVIYVSLLCVRLEAQHAKTPFEISNEKRTATYFETTDFYKQLDLRSNKFSLKEFGSTDSGWPLHLLLYSGDQTFEPSLWHKNRKVVILINNGIHAGEPDGIDASMMLMRDIEVGKMRVPQNVVLAIIPLYNIGGALNRNGFSRVNQKGPESYGFRGNAQNLDLNRDFTKNDSKNARVFASIFHFLEPHIFLDNHVSDGADYQHTMTLLSTQHNKLGGPVGVVLEKVLEPALYAGMLKKKFPLCPYVNFHENSPGEGWTAFFDAPRYSSGYTALFQTIGFTPETHMLKPFADRVYSTYALMQTLIEAASKNAEAIITAKQESIDNMRLQQYFPLSWKVDTNSYKNIHFKGYTSGYKKSDVTGMERLYYDRQKPFEKQVKFFNTFVPENLVTAPAAYAIPQGWWPVLDILKLNNVTMERLQKDSVIEVEVYRIDSYKSIAQPYEKHHKNYNVEVSKSMQKIQFLNGDYLIKCNQRAKRYLVEMLEPTGDDSFFAWNFFDAILQQKEGYSAYRWEDVAAAFLKQNSGVRKLLEEKKKDDVVFAQSPSAQLEFVYKHSPYYEQAHMRYPVYRIIQ